MGSDNLVAGGGKIFESVPLCPIPSHLPGWGEGGDPKSVFGFAEVSALWEAKRVCGLRFIRTIVRLCLRVGKGNVSSYRVSDQVVRS